MKRIPQWLSYHIHLPWTGNEFLINLPHFINQLKTERLIKRYFFIRYAEGGYHIRLRLYPTKILMEKVIENRLSKVLQELPETSQIQNSRIYFTVEDYSRQEHYFGENFKSVYAELINQETSDLSIKMLRTFSESSGIEFIIKIVPSVYWLLALSSFNNYDFNLSLEESIQFAFSNIALPERSQITEQSPSKNLTKITERMIEKVSTNLSVLPNLTRSANLMKRLKIRLNGRFVATHAVHLYCNKLGFTMNQELKLYKLIQSVEALKGQIILE